MASILQWVAVGLGVGLLWRHLATGSDELTKGVPTKRILLVGDSLASGLRHHISPRAAQHKVELDVRAKGGASVLDDFGLEEGLALRPDVTIIVLGANDFKRTWDAQRVRDRIPAVVAQVRQNGSLPLWVSPPTMPFSDDLGIRELWEHAVGADRTYHSEALSIDRLSDHIHPTSAGNEAWAAEIWPWAIAQQ